MVYIWGGGDWAWERGNGRKVSQKEGAWTRADMVVNSVAHVDVGEVVAAEEGLFKRVGGP